MQVSSRRQPTRETCPSPEAQGLAAAGPSGGTRETVVPYVGPRPQVGIHRYVLVLFQQRARMNAPPPMAMVGEAARANFTTRAFASRHDLELPVAAMYFNAQREPANRRRNY
ncbi:hypothetical protein SETIT_4G143700v2 [Setaria italica]|uniref:Uncharacterized protein n=1 Tax=Setaria italica TaxID=4555 RepID=K3Y2Z2_SETIT|nr:hypothetical protein SETIT_4G143700v2 [Setaria italica]